MQDSLTNMNSSSHKVVLPEQQCALAVSRGALEAAIREFGVNDARVGAQLNHLAFQYAKQSKYAKAISTYKRALEMLEASLPFDHPGRVVCLKNYAAVLRQSGNVANASVVENIVESLLWS
jgi:tetratricopeptide (TPR) repeat protein